MKRTIPPPLDNRAAERRSVGIKAHLREAGTTKLDITVEDLSMSGFRIESIYGIAVGARVFLLLPSFEPLEASVAWRNRSGYGCRFTRPLHPAVFDTIVARHKA